MDIIEYERVQLKLELEENGDSPENCFIEQALSELILREQQLFGKVCAINNRIKNFHLRIIFIRI